MKALFTPWRYRYISGRLEREPGCVFCKAFESPRPKETLTLRSGRESFVLMNRFPYTNGHLMIAPIRHAASLADLTPSCRAEMMELVVTSQGVLDEIYHPAGYNVGMNLGECAGAGIADHLHLHVVPRWSGDTNFMTPIAGTRLVPEALDDSFDRLRERFDRIETGGAGR